jgi:deazaflavin-dependent oxidoreductase (nitroreductase family)
VHEQVALYEATEGREGGTLEGRPVVILSTIGAKTGNILKNPVMRIKDGDTYVAVASNGGASNNPSWYRNLTAHPPRCRCRTARRCTCCVPEKCTARRSRGGGGSPNDIGPGTTNFGQRPATARFP